MKVLQYIGIAAMCLGYILKVMYLSGSHVMLLSGFVLMTLGAVAPVVSNWAELPVAGVLRPLLAVMLFGTGLILLFKAAEASIMMPGTLVLVVTFLVADGPWSASTRARDLPAWPLHVAAWLLLAFGSLLVLGHWPMGSAVYVLGVLAMVCWMLLQGKGDRGTDRP
jgi:hypothetical protein